MNTKSDILNKEFDFKVNHIGLNFDDNFWLKDSYIITINNIRFDYFQGIGHREVKKNLFINDKLKAEKLLNFNARKEVESYNYLLTKLNTYTQPKNINIDDVLYCLVLDSDLGNYSFSDFCDILGYDNDSIKALDIYLKCEKTKDKLHKIGINIENAIELFQDY